MENANQKFDNSKMKKASRDLNKVTASMKPTDSLKDAKPSYAYYSRVLNKPFDSLTELDKAEEAYYDEIKAKEAKAAEKKADASKVEETFKALNAARRAYKETLIKLTEKYSADLKALKETFETDKKDLQNLLAQAEDVYAEALKEFTSKHPEGYHLTLKDGDFETTISGSNKAATPVYKPFDIFDWFLGL